MAGLWYVMAVGTFAANVSGAFVLGATLETLTLLGPDGGWRRHARLFLGTGFCGAFTTYSALALRSTPSPATGSWPSVCSTRW